MKKAILILALLSAMTVALGLPAAIGWLAHDRLSATISESLPEARAEWDRGWFRSALRIEDEGLRARLEFRHVPLAPPGWISLTGLVTLTEPAATIDLRARLGFGGNISAAAEAPALDMPGPVTWRYRAPVLRLDTTGNNLELAGSAESLLIVDGLGNRLGFSEPTLEFRSRPGSGKNRSVRLTIEARRPGQAQSRLALDLSSIDPEPLGQLVEALGQLIGAEPGTARANLGAIGAASGWQQLGAAGLRIEIDELTLDGQLRLSGQWQPGSKEFVLTGEGARTTAHEWWANTIGLAEQLPPEQARETARQALQDLADQGVITLDRGQVSVKLISPRQGLRGD